MNRFLLKPTTKDDRRKHTKPIDLLSFGFKVLPYYAPDQVAKPPEDGIYVYGLFMEAGKWNHDTEMIEEQETNDMYKMPLIHFLPAVSRTPDPNDYMCPVYKTSVRAGVLSTTGQSTNFILMVELPTEEPPEFWTLRGTALISMLNT